MSIAYERVEVRSVHELHDWLAEHHTTAPGVWLVTWKKGRGPHLPWKEIVRELLCYGWIDTKGQRVDDDRTSLLVCPRRPGSGWSRINKEHIEVLRAEGRMEPAGQAVIDRAVSDGSWTRLDGVETLAEPDDLRRELDAVPEARAHWDAFPRSARRVILEWISSAKREPTRVRRVALTVSEAATGRRANERRPPSER